MSGTDLKSDRASFFIRDLVLDATARFAFLLEVEYAE